jgi:hypothetical protein
MIDVKSGPGWWLKRLMDDLHKRQDRLDMLSRYYRGLAHLPPVPAGSENSAYDIMQRKTRTPWAGLLVEAVRERMTIVGFRTGADQGDPAADVSGDALAWDVWQANNLDFGSTLVHRTKLSLGDAYVIVGPPEPGEEFPLITPEDPREVITYQDPKNPRRTLAALKLFTDDVNERDFAYLHLAGRWPGTNGARDRGQLAQLHVASRRHKPTDNVPIITASGGLPSWDWDDSLGGPLRTYVPPVVRFPNRADLRGYSMGEFEDSLDVLDRINHMVLQRMTIATLQAFRQRAVKGVPENDENGQPIDYSDVFAADPGALWHLPETAELWESGQVDMTGILQSVRHDIQDEAAVSRTPLFYLTPDAANGSAEGASLAREGLVFKTKDRIRETDDPWEQVMSHAFQTMGDEARAARRDMEVMWLSPENVSLAERADAAVKYQAAGVPWRTIMGEVLGFTPTQIDRMEAERIADQLAAPEPVAAPAPGPPTAPAPPPAPDAVPA